MELHDRRPTVAIPDLNGRYERLLLALDYAPPRDHFLVLMGDMIDEGNGSAQILRDVRQIHAEFGLQVLAGNHEELMINALFGPPGQRHAPDARPRDTDEWRRWLKNGGQGTLDSYRSKKALLEDAEWLRGHAKRWFIRDRWLYSHATRPHVMQRPITEEQLIATGVDLLLWDRPGGTSNLYELREDLIGSVHGHTPQRTPEKMTGPDKKPAWFIDLGKTARDIAVHHSEQGVKILKAEPITPKTPKGAANLRLPGAGLGSTSLFGLLKNRRASGQH
ncbi:metallophosphoesterase (plasmid) [Deinococcus sp. KNUC1210]|uniref:metallophosphoesterase n=1 Tax=Deinococcus sp. KNUC1210 TaxID=2917691 RepID=UPI001EEFC9EA|nr:metallophosphoesterase [Deinococcus sp. KNUC1210]ULH14213.1 metallophosphoesterase [Deinococcus sp. KNUC1210]